MRVVILFCLVLGSAATLRAETTEISSETHLARSYYSAIEQKDKTTVEKAVSDLQKHYPDDAITKLVVEHWQRQQADAQVNDWQRLKNSRRSKVTPQPKLTEEIVKVYQVADLVVSPGSTSEAHQDVQKSAEPLRKLLKDSCLTDAESDSVTFHHLNLCMVVRASNKSHAKCERLLTQLRRQQDLQLVYDITLASIEPELANSFSLRESISAAVFKQRLDAISKSENSSLVMAPKITLFNDQIASIETSSGNELTMVELHGQSTDDQRLIRTEFTFSQQSPAYNDKFQFASSELIADGQTAVFFIKTEDTNNALFDRRLLIENLVLVEPSTSNQLFLFVTPRILIQEEEEELLGANTTWPTYAYPHYSATTSDSANYPYAPLPPSGSWNWTPAKLEWDDGAWNLDFSTGKSNANEKKKD